MKYFEMKCLWSFHCHCDINKSAKGAAEYLTLAEVIR